MTSEIRANTLKNRVGLGTVSFTNTGPVVSGIVTIRNSTAEGVTLEDNAGVGNSLKITTPTGYVSIGSGNATFVHLNTDRGVFYFQRRIFVDEGIIGSYDENLTLQSPSNTNRIIINKDTGLVSILNDLDVDGHTNLDNVNIAGVTTTTENIHIKADNKQLIIGAHNDGDTLLYHDGNKSVLVNYTGDFHIRTNNGSRSSLEGIILKPNGATEIYHSGSKVFETDSLGVNVDGRLDVVGTGANDHLNVGTNTGRLRIGGYADLQLYHDSTNINYISNHNDIDLHITSTYGGSPVKTQAKFIHNGAVELYHNNDLRLQTWSDAVNIYGDEGEDAILHLYADEGDNNEDKWMLRAESSAQRFSIENYSSGSWVENIRITAGGLVELKHADGTTKMHTDTTGITVANRITGSGDSNTYINVGPNDIIDLYTGGSNVVRMNADGNLLVNKTSTSDKGRFEVKGPTANDIETSDISAKTIATFSGSTPGTTAAGKGAGIVIKPISDRGCNYFLGVANDGSNQEAHGRFIIRSGNFYNQSIERLRILANGNIKFATDNSSTDYLQWGSNPRLWLRCPSNMNGLRIDASTTPLEVRSSDANQRSISIGGSPNFDLSLSGDYSLSSSSQRDSSPTIYLNTTRWNGSTTVTSFQTSIRAVNTSNNNNIGYLGFGASASPTNLTIHTDNHICLAENDTSDLTDTCLVRIASTFKNTVRNGGGRCVERGFYSMNTGSGSVDYFHMKTDMATNSGCMFLFTLRGYAYGQGKVMFAQTCGYCYSASNNIINSENKSWDGHTVLSTYKSSDGYVVLEAHLPSWSSYYAGFHIDVSYQNPATGTMKYKVTAAAMNNTDNHYA